MGPGDLGENYLISLIFSFSSVNKILEPVSQGCYES